MQHDDDAERLRRALSKVPLPQDPAGAFAELDGKLQPELWRGWQALLRRVADEAPEELREWPSNRVAAAIWLNTLLQDVHAGVVRAAGGDAGGPALPPGAAERMQELHSAAEAMLSALVLTTLEHLQWVLEAAATGDEVDCPACALESRFTDVLRSVLGALDPYHMREGEDGDEGEEDSAQE